MNTTPVYVVGDENGSVITLSSNNPEYGWITLRQDQMLIHNGWLQNKSLSTIIMGKSVDLEKMNLAEGQVLEGCIYVKEQLEPFSSEDRDVKVAGSTGIVCSVNGQPIYRKTFYSKQHVDSTFIQHDNADEIRQALNDQKPGKVTTSTNSVEELADAFAI